MDAQVEEVAENRVRLTVDVPAHDVEHAVEHALSDLAASTKLPGFRAGKVPKPVLVARLGRERLMTEAVDSHIGGWFLNAASRARVRPVGRPEYAWDALPGSSGEPWRFTAEVDVQPKPELPDWKELEVPRREVEVPGDLVDRELYALRSTVAALAPVEDRPVQRDDTVVLDLVNLSGEVQRDYVVELGTGRVVPEVEDAVVGMAVGETKTVEFELSDDQTGSVELTVKEIKEKVLPPLDDDLARAASEFDTLDELRADIESRLREQVEAEVEGEFRAAVADALVEASQVNAAGPLVESRTRELVNGFIRSVESRGIPFESYLQLTNTQPEELLARMRAEAQQSVARELVLEAAADELGLAVADDEVDAIVREQAGAEGDDADTAIEGLRHSGAYERLREDLRLRGALDRLAAEVKPISPDLAAARDKLWTPDKEKPAAETKVWTPGSKEPSA